MHHLSSTYVWERLVITSSYAGYGEESFCLRGRIDVAAVFRGVYQAPGSHAIGIIGHMNFVCSGSRHGWPAQFYSCGAKGDAQLWGGKLSDAGLHFGRDLIHAVDIHGGEALRLTIEHQEIHIRVGAGTHHPNVVIRRDL